MPKVEIIDVTADMDRAAMADEIKELHQTLFDRDERISGLLESIEHLTGVRTAYADEIKKLKDRIEDLDASWQHTNQYIKRLQDEIDGLELTIQAQGHALVQSALMLKEATITADQLRMMLGAK